MGRLSDHPTRRPFFVPNGFTTPVRLPLSARGARTQTTKNGVPAMNRTRTDAEERELAALIREQQHDDRSNVQRPQEFAGVPTASYEAIYGETYREGVPDIADEVVDRLSGETPAPDLEAADHVGLGAVLAELPPDLAETYALIYGERLSTREAGDRLGISHVAVIKRVKRLHTIVTGAL